MSPWFTSASFRFTDVTYTSVSRLGRTVIIKDAAFVTSVAPLANYHSPSDAFTGSMLSSSTFTLGRSISRCHGLLDLLVCLYLQPSQSIASRTWYPTTAFIYAADIAED